MVGTVYLVGAGPGDPDLLTVRAAKLLSRAGVVVHDALVSESVLELAPSSAELIDAGKRCGGRKTRQHEIHETLIAAAARTSTVVRLKGGDPFIFGRGGEEAEALWAAGVRFEIVPGITAAIGAAAYAGIPLTHRDLSSVLTIVTAHEAADHESRRIDWSALAAQDGTLAIYMGAGRMNEIAQRLIRGGRDPDTPVAFIERATCPQQRTIVAPLRHIARRVAETGLGAPAIILIGRVVALHEKLSSPGATGRRTRPSKRVLESVS